MRDTTFLFKYTNEMIAQTRIQAKRGEHGD